MFFSFDVNMNYLYTLRFADKDRKRQT